MPLVSLIVLTVHLINRHIFQGLRLSVVPVVAGLVVWYNHLGYAQGMGDSVFLAIAAAAGMLIVFSLCVAWFAVRWHRFLLLAEPQHPLATDRPIDVFTRYGWRLFRLIFGLLFAGVLILIFLDMLLRPGPLVHAFLINIVWFMVFWVFLRLSPVLPGIAVDRVMRLHEAWAATGKQAAPLFGLAVALFVMTVGIQLMIPVEGAAASALDAVFVLVTFWVQVLIHTTAVTAIFHAGVLRR